MTRHLTMRVYIAQKSGKADEKQIKRWIGDLDSDQFAVRDAAFKELANLGNAAGAELRRVLDGRPSAEVRRQIDMLLERLEAIDLARLQIPAGVTVLEIKDLLDRYRAGLKSAVAEIRGHACGGLGELAGHTEEAIPLLIEALKTDKHEYVRRYAASALGRCGKRAAAALPVLKEGLKDNDKNIQQAFAQVIEMIEGAKEDPGWEEKARTLKAIREEIDTFRRTAKR